MKLRTFGAALSGMLLAASLVACGGTSEETTETTTDTASTEEEVVESTVYTIATDTAFAPFEYTDASGNLVGIDMEILAAVAEDQGFEYTVDSVGFDAALQSVQSSQADAVIAGMSITDERKEIFDFSDPYYDSTVCCAVAADSGITSLDELAGMNVAVKTGTQSKAWAESIADVYGFTTTEFADSDVMYQDVLAGNSAACFEDTPVMGYAISSGNVSLQIIDEVDSESEYATPYGFAVKKGENAELLQMFNVGLANIKANGTYDQILANYISTGAADEAVIEEADEAVEESAEAAGTTEEAVVEEVE